MTIKELDREINRLTVDKIGFEKQVVGFHREDPARKKIVRQIADASLKITELKFKRRELYDAQEVDAAVESSVKAPPEKFARILRSLVDIAKDTEDLDGDEEELVEEAEKILARMERLA